MTDRTQRLIVLNDQIEDAEMQLSKYWAQLDALQADADNYDIEKAQNYLYTQIDYTEDLLREVKAERDRVVRWVS